MTLTSNEILILATPVVGAALAALMSWRSYVSVMRQRNARKAKNLDEALATAMSPQEIGEQELTVVELTPAEVATMRSILRRKRIIRLSPQSTRATAK